MPKKPVNRRDAVNIIIPVMYLWSRLSRLDEETLLVGRDTVVIITPDVTRNTDTFRNQDSRTKTLTIHELFARGCIAS